MKKSTIRLVFGMVLALGLSCVLTACSNTVRTTGTVATTTVEITETQATTIESTRETTAEITTTQSSETDLPDSFPLLDSSTARIPITNALYALFVGEYGLPGPQPICSKTHQAWLNLADGTVDLILCIAPTVEEKAYLFEKQVDVEMRLYGCDGLVFLGNSENPVKNLTQSQIKGIYRGAITNWRELGGPDQKIIAYYRDDQSGSQRFFEDLVWKGEEIPDFDSLDLIELDGMDEITDTVINDPFAIGFNIMSYINFEYSDPRLMLFTVDGVAPSTATLADASYAYITQAYVIINADEPKDSPARWLFNWFGCEKSREIIRDNSSLSIIFSEPILLKTSEQAP